MKATKLYLTKEEERMLKGEYGIITQKSMKILVTLGEIFGAKQLGNISSAHIQINNRNNRINNRNNKRK